MDSNYIIRDITVCPGSNTDQHIWNVSEKKAALEALRSNAEILNAEGPYFIIGNKKINYNQRYYIIIFNIPTIK